MAMRWRLWEDEFHTSMFDSAAGNPEDDTAMPCQCSGRGKPRPQLSQLRLPSALHRQREEGRRGGKGKGRAGVLQQRVVSSKGQGPGRHRKSNPLDDICSVSSGSSCSSQGFGCPYPGQFSGQLSGQLCDYLPSASECYFSGSDSGRRHHILDLSCDVPDQGRHLAFGTPEWPDRDCVGFGTRPEQPQLDLVRDFPPLGEKQISERGSAKMEMSIGEIAHSLCESNNKMSHEETKVGVEGEQMQGDDVVVIRGLPPSCKEEMLQELLCPYGQVLHCQRTSASSGRSATFVVRFDSTEACDWAVSCLDNMEGFPGSKITVERRQK